MPHPLANDLDHVLEHTRDLWPDAKGQRLFLTGGTGFFGCWLLESFLWANERLDINAQTVVLTRDPQAFARKAPTLAAHPALRLHQGDVRDFSFPTGSFSHVIHAATDSSGPQALDTLETIIQGTRRTLDFAASCGTKRFLLTSSGAVYGRQPPEMTHLGEDFSGGPDPQDAGSAYGEGKRVAEWLCGEYARKHGIEATIARCFAFVGPHLPLDVHFAIGNFIRDGLRGARIEVKGDGTPWRSYLYAADLAIWLWTIFFRGVSGRPYNVGSDQTIQLGELAARVAAFFGASVEIRGRSDPGQPAQRYVPSTARAAGELGLKTWIGLDEALERTARWHRRGST